MQLPRFFFCTYFYPGGTTGLPWRCHGGIPWHPQPLPPKKKYIIYCGNGSAGDQRPPPPNQTSQTKKYVSSYVSFCSGPSIRICREIQCLPYAGFYYMKCAGLVENSGIYLWQLIWNCHKHNQHNYEWTTYYVPALSLCNIKETILT